MPIQSAAEELVLSTFKDMLATYSSKYESAESPERQKLYVFLAYYFMLGDWQLATRYKKDLLKEYPFLVHTEDIRNECMKRQQTIVGQLFKFAAENFDALNGGDIAAVKELIEPDMAKILGAVQDVIVDKSRGDLPNLFHNIPAYAVFQFVHMFGMQESFETHLHLYKNLKKAYPSWKAVNERFIAKCATFDAAADKVDTAPKIESRHAVPARYSIENLRQVFGSNESTLSILNGIQNDDFRALLIDGFKRTIGSIKDMSHSQMQEAIGINPNLPEEQQRKAFRAHFSEYNESYLRHAVERFEELTEPQKTLIAFRILGLFGFEKRREIEQELGGGLAYDQDEMRQKNKQPVDALDVETKINLCKAVHLYELDGIYDEEVKRGRVPKPLRDFYKNWAKGKSGREYIDACKKFANDLDVGSPLLKADMQHIDTNAGVDEIWRARTKATNLHLKRFYDLLILSNWAEDLNKEFGARKASKTAPIGPKMTFMVRNMGMTQDDFALYFILGNPILLHILNTPKDGTAFSPEYMAYLKSFSEVCLDPKSKIGASVLDCVEEKVGADSLFRFVHFVGIQDSFSRAIEQGDVPSSIVEAYKKWSESAIGQTPVEVHFDPVVAEPSGELTLAVRQHHEDPVGSEISDIPKTNLDNAIDNPPEPVSVTLEEREMRSAAFIDPLLADPRVTYIDVHHPLVTSGNQTQSMGYSPVDEDRNLETGLSQGDDFQDRTRNLLKVLVGDAKSGVQKITVRWDRHNANDDNIEGRPYNLIDIEMQDGSRSRVAVCDYKGHMTYVERDAFELQDQETLQISALRASRKVWTAVHVNDKQWCERIQEVLYTPLETLTPELKSRSYWHGLKGVLTETFAATVMATGNLPAATDDRIVEYGPLAGRTTYSRMYNAANRGAVSGLEKGTTYKKLFTELSSGQMPELNQFMNRTPLQAVDILAAWEDVRQELGPEITIDDFADCVKVDVRDHRAINLALRFGAVQGFDKVSSLERIMADKSLAPKSLRAFLRLVEQVNPMALAA